MRLAIKPKVHRVTWHTPLKPAVDPYINRLGVVRHLEYGRLQAALNLLRTNSAGRALEIGCWAGYFLPSLLKHFPEVWGVDDDSASVVDMLPGYSTILQVARKLCEAELGDISGLRLTKATGCALPFPDQYFDAVFCMDTLAHVARPLRRDLINELLRVTKPDGQLIFSLPVENGPMLPVKHLLRMLTGKRIDRNTTLYDFRPDLELLRASFAVCRLQFFPIHVLGRINPFVLVDCRIEIKK